MVSVLCLVPARNAAADLPGFFESAGRFADGIIALDDGSTDNTLSLLEANPLVKRVIRNPRREDYRGWDDAANRNALLAAAAEFAPDWIVSLDADERFDSLEATALREFLETDALPGVGYGFRCYSMAGDLDHALPNPIWVYRMFAFSPGQRFPDQALHFAPIPTSIPKQALLRTSFRIQHLGGMSPERRRARYEKYRQADPDCRFWPDYSSLLKNPDPSDAIAWQPRDPREEFYFSQPIADDARDEIDIPIDSPTGPRISVIVMDSGPTAGVTRALDSVPGDPDIEVLFVTSRADVPGSVRCTRVAVDADARPGEMRNAGLRAAHGTFVCFLDGEIALADGAIDALLAAHGDGYAVVTGAVQPVTTSAAQTAMYLHRFGPDRPGRAAGIVDGPARWASYSRSLLEEFGGFSETESTGEEIGLNRELAWRGYLTYRVAKPVVKFDAGHDTSLMRAARSAFGRGAAAAGFMLDAYADRGELAGKKFVSDRLVRQLPKRMKTIRSHAARLDGRAAPGVRESVPLATVEVAQWAGQWNRLLRPARGKSLVLAGRPAGVAAVVVQHSGEMSWIALVRFDLVASSVRVAVIPPDLNVPDASGSPRSVVDALGLRGAAGDHADFSVFSAHDALGRSFDVQIDDLLWIDGRALPHALWSGSLAGVIDYLHSASTLVSLWRARRRGRIWSTLSARAFSLALPHLRRLELSNFEVMHVPLLEGGIDTDLASMVRAFLDADRIRRPMTQRESLRRVEWA